MSSMLIPYIIAELKRRGGLASEKELYESVAKALKSNDSVEISPKEFNKLLLILETRGIVRVSFLKKNLRAVQLVAPPQKNSEGVR